MSNGILNPGSRFDDFRRRLYQLERWRELAIRPTRHECHEEDIELLGLEVDDCQELERRCLLVRTSMNDNLPGMDECRDQELVPEPSTIPDAGLGLFYKPPHAQPIPVGETICFYWGHVHNFRSASILVEKGYLMLVHGDVLVDPGPLPHIKARYINDSLNETFVNCKFVPETYRSAVVCTREIYPGDELFVSYGEAYWAQQETIGRCKA
jgi:SET domain